MFLSSVCQPQVIVHSLCGVLVVSKVLIPPSFENLGNFETEKDTS